MKLAAVPFELLRVRQAALQGRCRVSTVDFGVQKTDAGRTVLFPHGDQVFLFGNGSRGKYISSDEKMGDS